MYNYVHIYIYIHPLFFIGDFLVFCRYPKIQWMLPKVIAAILRIAQEAVDLCMHTLKEAMVDTQTLGFHICLTTKEVFVDVASPAIHVRNPWLPIPLDPWNRIFPGFSKEFHAPGIDLEIPSSRLLRSWPGRLCPAVPIATCRTWDQ